MSDPKDRERRVDDEATSGLEKHEDGPRVSRLRVGAEDIIVLSVPLPELHFTDLVHAEEVMSGTKDCEGLGQEPVRSSG